MMRLICLLLALPTFLAATEKQRIALPNGPLVQSANGALAGKLDGDIAVFQGIPFARPPVGALRWREPQPVSNWAGARDATKPGHPCMQNEAGTDNFIAPLAAAYGAEFTRDPVDPSEDCLYLNVWTPRLSSNPLSHPHQSSPISGILVTKVFPPSLFFSASATHRVIPHSGDPDSDAGAPSFRLQLAKGWERYSTHAL